MMTEVLGAILRLNADSVPDFAGQKPASSPAPESVGEETFRDIWAMAMLGDAPPGLVPVQPDTLGKAGAGAMVVVSASPRAVPLAITAPVPDPTEPAHGALQAVRLANNAPRLHLAQPEHGALPSGSPAPVVPGSAVASAIAHAMSRAEVIAAIPSTVRQAPLDELTPKTEPTTSALVPETGALSREKLSPHQPNLPDEAQPAAVKTFAVTAQAAPVPPVSVLPPAYPTPSANEVQPECDRPAAALPIPPPILAPQGAIAGEPSKGSPDQRPASMAERIVAAELMRFGVDQGPANVAKPAIDPVHPGERSVLAGHVNPGMEATPLSNGAPSAWMPPARYFPKPTAQTTGPLAISTREPAGMQAPVTALPVDADVGGPAQIALDPVTDHRPVNLHYLTSLVLLPKLSDPALSDLTKLQDRAAVGSAAVSVHSPPKISLPDWVQVTPSTPEVRHCAGDAAVKPALGGPGPSTILGAPPLNVSAKVPTAIVSPPSAGPVILETMKPADVPQVRPMLKTQPVVSPLLETTLDVADEQPAVSIADKPMLLLMGNPILDPLAVSGADLVATDTRPSLLQPLPNSVPDVRSSQLPARQIAESLAAPAEGRIEVRLDPEELGTVKVTLVPDGDRMRVMIVADRPETMELLRRNSNDLAQEFRTIGYDTTSFSFGQSRRDNQSRDGFAPADVDLTEPAATSPSPVADGSLDLRL